MKNIYLSRYKKITRVAKTWWPAILILPPMLGGIWQIIELSMIDLAFIRFFSSTQLLADGLLILLILTVAIIPLLIIILFLNLVTFVKNTNKKTDIKKCKKEGNDIGVFFASIMFFIFAIGIGISIYDDINFPLNKLSFVSFFGNLIMFYVILLFSIFGFRLSCQCFNINYRNIIKKYKLSNILRVISITFRAISMLIVVIVDIFAIYVSISAVLLFIHYKYNFPDNLTNLKHLDNKIKNEKYIFNILLYSNDKYIFLEHTDKNHSKSIEIFKFDDLFEK